MDAPGIEARVEGLYGEVDWLSSTGILHVAAVQSPTNRIIALGPTAPRSATDRFVLGLARARADAIVTTGSILRAEPDLTHAYADDARENAELAEWRERVLRRTQPPALIVLSASANFRIDHPALRAARTGFVWSSRAGRERLRGSALSLPVEVDEAPRVDASGGGVDRDASGEGPSGSRDVQGGVGAALACARGKLGARTILIEAGPTTAASLYPTESPAEMPSPTASRVDELLLSHFEGPLDPAAIGAPFIAPELIESLFEAPASVCRIEEPSGFWRFERRRARVGRTEAGVPYA